MNVLRSIRDYICYCGIKKEEYNALKKDAYISNFEVWRALHCLMALIFALMFLVSLNLNNIAANRVFYLLAFIYSAAMACLFAFVLKKDSIIAQLVIYLSISLLFLFAAFITQSRPENPATTFIVLLLITPMFMIDKPYFMAIELGSASVIYLVWMRSVKPYDVWQVDLGNIVIFTVVGIFLHIIANSIRIREFVLAKKISIQKDTDELTGLKNKGALTREINEFLAGGTKGLLFMFDIDHFKAVNDTYGHDVGDDVIKQFGAFLGTVFKNGEIVGRFGGDEFIVFTKDTDDVSVAQSSAQRITDEVADRVLLPDKDRKLGISVGIAVYRGEEKNYSEIFKKADIALYKTKSDRTVKFCIYSESDEDNGRRL